ncbi:formate dehydrogenase subunit gamma [Aquabacterium sp. OR-4]|uniref:formate dehydrogenase subunit gamma n=1 Tax=Aquabacterium sp. OR-4 TaxID=2978127 RepID=UPI0028CA130C|nr:formate dehydrogenase subunit gamma [Aquabacterium sp. OR-4]MDT7838532.1 formate dehydrogenase subunit gamma [Aquabacterium sp. OR-4]
MPRPKLPNASPGPLTGPHTAPSAAGQGAVLEPPLHTTAPTTAPTTAQQQALAAAVAAQAGRPGALLPVLHALQAALGHVPPALVPGIAQALNLSRAEVHGVISYYHHFRSQPAGRHVLQLCRAEACQANGGEALASAAQALLGCAMHNTRADGAVTLEPVYCLGLCATGPALQIDDRLHARMTPERLAQRLHGLGLLAAPALPASPPTGVPALAGARP